MTLSHSWGRETCPVWPVQQEGCKTTMADKKRWFPFNLEQTVNILSEFGPLVTMFVVNAVTGDVNIGTWALIISTVIAMVVMWSVLGRLPVFPLIASTVTITFGALALIMNDPWYVKVKVTIFNVMFGCFLLVGLLLKKNFFKYTFEKTFHYTDKGWFNFTISFAGFFFLTAVLNEIVSQTFHDKTMYEFMGYKMNGTNVWIAFKVAVIMPLSGLYAWFLTRLMQKHRIDLPNVPESQDAHARSTDGHGSSVVPKSASPTRATDATGLPAAERARL
jgi:intracellular septation protein